MRHSLELTVELYRRGNYELLGLFGKQEKALSLLQDQITNEVLYGGAARGGKSWLLSVWKILNRLAYDGSQGLIAREEMTKLKDTTQKTFWKVCDFLELQENVDYIFHAGKQEVEFYNGSVEIFRELKFLGVKDPEFDRIGSYDLTDAAVDEAQQIHWKARDVLKGRYSVLRGEREVMKNGIKTKEPWRLIPKAFYSCNPSKNWIYTDFYEPDKKEELPDNMAFIPALPTDNPHVDPAYIENLKTADKITRARLLNGNFDYDDDPDALCTWEAICDIFNNDHVKPDISDKWITSDLAMSGRDMFIAMNWEGFVGYVALKREKSTGKSIENDLRSVKVSKSVPNRRIIADSDGMGEYLSSYLENIREFHGGKSPTNFQEGKTKFGKLKDQCGFKLAEKINASEMKIICSKEDEEEIKRQISICLKRSTNVDDEKKRLIKKSEMKEKLGYSPDFLDDLIMRMLPEVEEEYDVFV